MPQLMPQTFQPTTSPDARRQSIQIRSDTWHFCVPIWFLVHCCSHKYSACPCSALWRLVTTVRYEIWCCPATKTDLATSEERRGILEEGDIGPGQTTGTARPQPHRAIGDANPATWCRGSQAHHVYLLTSHVQIIWIDVLSLVNSWLLTTEDLIRFEANPYGVWWWTKWQWDRNFAQYFSFPCPHHSTNAPHSFI